MKKSLAILALLVGTAAMLPADWDWDQDRDHRSAPEIDPGTAANAILLIGGGLMMLRARRRA